MPGGTVPAPGCRYHTMLASVIAAPSCWSGRWLQQMDWQGDDLVEDVERTATDPSLPAVQNVFSIDVEGFAESNEESFQIGSEYRSEAEEKAELEVNMRSVFECLDGCGVKGTFFFLGTVARRLPHLVREASDLGHEIGSHSFSHFRIFGLEEAVFREEMAASKQYLEDLTGKPVLGFRAPDFSITERSRWALDVLIGSWLQV